MPSSCARGDTALVVTYGMGVHWAKAASRDYPGQIEILDLRTLNPLDFEAVTAATRRHGKVLVLTEEPLHEQLRRKPGWAHSTPLLHGARRAGIHAGRRQPARHCPERGAGAPDAAQRRKVSAALGELLGY